MKGTVVIHKEGQENIMFGFPGWYEIAEERATAFMFYTGNELSGIQEHHMDVNSDEYYTFDLDADRTYPAEENIERAIAEKWIEREDGR